MRQRMRAAPAPATPALLAAAQLRRPPLRPRSRRLPSTVRHHATAPWSVFENVTSGDATQGDATAATDGRALASSQRHQADVTSVPQSNRPVLMRHPLVRLLHEAGVPADAVVTVAAAVAEGPRGGVLCAAQRLERAVQPQLCEVVAALQLAGLLLQHLHLVLRFDVLDDLRPGSATRCETQRQR